MKKFLSLALALTMALTLAACGGKTDTPPADTNDGSTAGQTGGKLVVYSALNEDNTIAIADQFKKDTGIEIEYISLGGGDAPWPCAGRDGQSKGRHSGRRLCGPVWLFGHRRCF